MRIIREFPNGYVEAVDDRGWDFLMEKGDFIEIDGLDYRIYDITTFEGVPVYQCRRVV